MRLNGGQLAGGHCCAAGWVSPTSHHAWAAPHHTCSSFALCWGNSSSLGKNQWNVFSTVVFPSSSSLSPPLVQFLFTVRSPQAPLCSFSVSLTPALSSHLRLPLQWDAAAACSKSCCRSPTPCCYPRLFSPACWGREAGEGEEGGLCLSRAARREGSPPPWKVLTVSVKQSNASILLLLMALAKIPPGGL